MSEEEFDYENEEYFKNRPKDETIFKTLGIFNDDSACTKAA